MALSTTRHLSTTSPLLQRSARRWIVAVSVRLDICSLAQIPLRRNKQVKAERLRFKGRRPRSVELSVLEGELQQKRELTRRQVQLALHRGSPKAALACLSAFAQDIQDAVVSTPRQQRSGSQGPKCCSSLPSLRTRTIIGDLLRGLPRQIIQVCIEQVSPKRGLKSVARCFCCWLITPTWTPSAASFASAST